MPRAHAALLAALAAVLAAAVLPGCGGGGGRRATTTSRPAPTSTSTTAPPETVLVTTTSSTVPAGPPVGRALPGQAIGAQSDIDLVSMAPDHLEAFWVGTDGEAWHSAWTGAEWLPPESLGGSVRALGAASPRDGVMELFAASPDGRLLRNSFTSPGTWSGWFAVQAGGAEVAVDGGPDAWAPDARTVEVVFRDPATGGLGAVRIGDLPGNGQVSQPAPTTTTAPADGAAATPPTRILGEPAVCGSRGRREVYARAEGGGELLRSSSLDGSGFARTGVRPASAVDCAAGVLVHLDGQGRLVVRTGSRAETFPGPSPVTVPTVALAGDLVEVQWVDRTATRRAATRPPGRPWQLT